MKVPLIWMIYNEKNLLKCMNTGIYNGKKLFEMYENWDLQWKKTKKNIKMYESWDLQWKNKNY